MSIFIVFYFDIKVKWNQSYLFLALTLLYYINNNLYLQAFKYASAPAIQLLLYVKIPSTVVMHHFFIKRQHRAYPWILLSFLLFGAIVSQLTDKFEIKNTAIISICMVLSVNSAIASIYNETLMKSLDMDFWSQQVFDSYSLYNGKVITYTLTAFWSLVHLSITSNLHHTFVSVIHLDRSVLWYMVVIALLSGFAGIFTGMIIKSMDTIVRLLSGVIVSMLVTIGIYLTFSKSPDSWVFFSIGSFIISCSVFLYGKDMKDSSSVYNEIMEGQKRSIRRLLLILVLALPISFIMLFKY
jgi:hypothetical protein